MKLRLIAFLLKRTELGATIRADLGQRVFSVAKFAPSAWNNDDQTELRKLYVLLGGRNNTLKEWRQ